MNDPWEDIPVDKAFTDDPAAWLAAYARKHELKWLLAHADDGVIWGEMRSDGLALSPEPAPKLRAKTLQQVRLFGEPGELWLWRADGGFAGRWIDGDGGAEPACADEYLHESYLLWGVGTGTPRDNDFTELVEGLQELSHLIPLKLEKDERARLFVRHYLAYDDQGQAYISHSRLVGLPQKEDPDGAKA